MRRSLVFRLVVGAAACALGCANSPTDTQQELDASRRAPMDATMTDGAASASDSATGQSDSSFSGDTGSPGPGSDGGSTTDSGGMGGGDGSAMDAGATDSGESDGADGQAAGDSSAALDSATLGDTNEPVDGSHPEAGGDAADGSRPADSGPVTDGGGPDGARDTGAMDSGQADTSTCVVAVSSQGAFDGGTCPAPVTSSCGPGSPAGFTPTYRAPTGEHQALCTSAMLTQIYTDCLDPNLSDPLACSSDETSFPACYACLVSQETDTRWGPLIQQASGIVEINISGCIALLEPCNVACAQAYQYSYQCEVVACDSNCAADSQIDVTPYDNCTVTADDCSCQVYFDPGQCELNIAGSHPAASCTTQTSFQAYYNLVAPLFCGQ
jgi:hypothetical protein